jgi:hypothetical protein
VRTHTGHQQGNLKSLPTFLREAPGLDPFAVVTLSPDSGYSFPRGDSDGGPVAFGVSQIYFLEASFCPVHNSTQTHMHTCALTFALIARLAGPLHREQDCYIPAYQLFPGFLCLNSEGPEGPGMSFLTVHNKRKCSHQLPEG